MTTKNHDGATSESRTRDLRFTKPSATESSSAASDGVDPTGGTWVFGVLIHFADGGPPAEQILHVGTRDECERVSGLLPAVAYSGGRMVAGAERVICPMPTVKP